MAAVGVKWEWIRLSTASHGGLTTASTQMERCRAKVVTKLLDHGFGGGLRTLIP